MVYRQRYYKEITHEDGKVIRLEFWTPDDSIADAVELGNVIQSLNLEIQNGGDIDQPIVKTQLNFTLIDAPDHEEAKTKKCGSWEEFYSPNATAWMVKVNAKNYGESGFKTIWGGYITPDSFRESLTYRSGVSFIARDNIGHMQDFPFDAEGNADGMITLGEIIELAWEKIASPMKLTIDTNNAQWMQVYGQNALNTYMNVSAFKDKNWYEVLESVLFAYGLVMRYVGNNKVMVYPLRNLPNYGFENLSEVVPIFETGAERELSPAVRRIEESMDYPSADYVVKLPTTKDLTGSYIEREDSNGNKYQLWPLTNFQDGQGWINKTPSNTLIVNPNAYGFSADLNITDEQKQYVYDHLFLRCAFNGGVEYSRYVVPSPVELTLTLGKMIFQSATQSFIAYEDDEADQWLFPQIKYAISVVQNGITNWLQSDGTFGTSAATLTYQFEEGYNRSVNIKADLSKFTGQVLFVLHIKQITGLGGAAENWLIALEGLSIKAGGSALTANHVNTNYREENNVILSRNPQIAPAMANTLLPSMVENGIFYKSGDFYYPANKWSWNGNAAQQMAVYNHLQLLCFYAKPNNILTGNILNSDVTNFARIYRWNGTEHIITSGTLNLLNGFIENASLREFMRYEDMWGDMTDAADLPDVDGGTMSTVQGGAGTTSNAASYTNTTEVNIGGSGGTIVLDSYMSDSSTNGVQNRVIKAYVDSENARQDESITTIINKILEDGAALAAMWKLSDDGSSVKTEKNVLIKGYTAIHSGNIGIFSVANANTATKLANKRKLWGQEFDGSEDIVGSLQFNAIAGNGWYRGIKFMDSDGVTQLSFIGAYGLSTGFQYVYIGGTHTSPHFSIDANGKAIFNGVLEPKKNVYCANSVYVRGAHLMLGNKEAGIYLTKTGIWWHDENDSWVANLLGFDKTTLKVYQTLRPNTNQLCALGSSSYRWSGIYAATGDFSGNVSVKGNLIVTGDVASA